MSEPHTSIPDPLRILFLEDSDSDIELMLFELRRLDVGIRWERADDEASFLAALEREHDVILADYNLPQFDAVRALGHVMERAPSSVFIVVTGALGDAAAADLFANGATDYLLKDRLARLIPAITQALRGRELRERQRQAELELSQFFEITHDLMAILDFEERFRRINSAWHDTLRWDVERLHGSSFFDLVHPADLKSTRIWLEEGRRGVGGFHEIRCRTRDGEFRWLQLSARPIRELERIFIVARDVTDDRMIEAELERQANYDPLTNLANRRRFEEHVGRLLSERRRSPARFTLLYLDLDGFKGVNDTYGHLIGDELLVQLAARLEHSLREGDMVARIGGDEFVMLLSTDAVDEIEAILHRVRRALDGPYALQGNEVRVGASIGVAVYPRDGADFDELLRAADRTMYRAKRGGGGVAYCADDDGAAARTSPAAVLRSALGGDDDALRLHFQPVVELATGRTLRHEALLRWRSPDDGYLAPASLLAAAEAEGLGADLDRWVVTRALAWAAERGADVAVNLASGTLRDPAFVAFVAERLEAAGLAPDRLELELPEAVLAEPEATAPQARALRALGVHVALDDFGGGSAALTHAADYPADTLKLAPSLTAAATDGARGVAEALVRLARSLDRTVVAEGVEGETQLRWLASLGCDRAQGFWLGRPVAGDDAPAAPVVEGAPERD